MRLENQAVANILSAAKTIAVVGLSDDPTRVSRKIAAYLQKAGYRIIPVNPQIISALGERAYPHLDDVEEHIDIVNVFRRPEKIPPLADAALKKRPSAFWMQEGIAHSESARRLEDAGIPTIQDLCIKVAHRALMGATR